MFTRHKLHKQAKELSLCGAIYPRQQNRIHNDSEAVSAEDVLAMLGPSSVGCACKIETGLRDWVTNNVH